jgi:hypothetical protein
MYKKLSPMKNGTGCGCGCIKSMTQSNINSSNHIDPFKAANYNNFKDNKILLVGKELVKKGKKTKYKTI